MNDKETDLALTNAIDDARTEGRTEQMGSLVTLRETLRQIASDKQMLADLKTLRDATLAIGMNSGIGSALELMTAGSDDSWGVHLSGLDLSLPRKGKRTFEEALHEAAEKARHLGYGK